MRRARAAEGTRLHQVLLVLAVCYLGLVGNRVLRGGAGFSLAEGAVLAGFALCLLTMHGALALSALRGDEGIVPLVGLLTGLGVLLKLRLMAPGTALAPRALAIYPLAMATLVLAAWVCRRRLHWLEAVSTLAGLAALLVLALVARHGVAFRGGHYGPGLTTPTELVKPLMVVFIAGFLKQRRVGWEWLGFAAVWLAALYLIHKKSDLGLIVILGSLLLSMWFVATGRARLIFAALAAAAALVAAVYFLQPAEATLVESRRFTGEAGRFSAEAGRSVRRIDAWLDPWRDPQRFGYQTAQSMFALAAGGLDGAGLGAGFARLTPLVDCDFIWAAIAEDFGLIGCAILLVAYLALCRRGYRIAALSTHPFRQRLAVGCVTVLAIQTLLNIGGVVRVVPITGLPLPFVSHGGTSLLVCYALIGLILAVGDDVELGEWNAVDTREGCARKDSNLRPSD